MPTRLRTGIAIASAIPCCAWNLNLLQALDHFGTAHLQLCIVQYPAFDATWEILLNPFDSVCPLRTHFFHRSLLLRIRASKLEPYCQLVGRELSLNLVESSVFSSDQCIHTRPV